METKNNGYTTVDEYIAEVPEHVQTKLQEIRAVIRAAAPEAVEKISYKMPCYMYKGYVVYFAAHKGHIGLYGASGALDLYSAELARYRGAKSSLHFPLDQPLPLDLIQKIVEFRVAENVTKAEMKAQKKKASR